MRWRDYVLARDGHATETVERLWKAGCDGRKTYFVLGHGFDPRATVGLKRYLSLNHADTTVIIIGLRPQAADSATKTLADANTTALQELERTNRQAFVRLAYPAVEEPRSAGLRIARGLLESSGISAGCAVIVDVSSLPSSVSFPIVGALLRRSEKEPFELQVVACENPGLDDAVVEQGVVDAGPIGGFKHSLDLDVKGSEPRVWAPVLGRGREAALRAIYTRLEPNEFYPVLPFPARNPRRGDDLLIEYRDFLDSAELETRNIIYASESDPFDVYRTLSTLKERYRDTLAPLGETTVVVSTHASKVLSIGVLLAAYEHNLSVMTATPSEYALDEGVAVEELSADNRLTCLWLDGVPYTL